MSCESSNLVSESLGLDGGRVINDSFVGVEIDGQPAIRLFYLLGEVLLNECFG
jgi:hypothetical protein